MKAALNGIVIVETPKEDLVSIEGNCYFLLSSVKTELLKEGHVPHSPVGGSCSKTSLVVVVSICARGNAQARVLP